MQRRLDTVNFRRMGYEIAGVITAIAGLSYKCIKIAGDVVETRNMFKWTFRENAKDAEKWADTYSESVGRWKNDVMNWMAILNNTLVPMGYSRKGAAEMSEQLVKLSVDVASFMNKADTDVLWNFQSAMVGNVRAVRQYGIMLDQTNIQQELYNMGIKKSVTSATAIERAQARYNLIIKGTRDAEGDAIRTRYTFINQLKELHSNVMRSAELIGEGLRPAVNEYLVAFNKWMVANKQWLSAEIVSHLKSLLDNIINLCSWMYKYRDVLLLVAKGALVFLVFERAVVIIANLGLAFKALGLHLDRVIAAFLKMPAGLSKLLGGSGAMGVATAGAGIGATAFIVGETLVYLKKSGDYLKDLKQYELDFDKAIKETTVSLDKQNKELDAMYDFTTHKFKTKPGPFKSDQDLLMEQQWKRYGGTSKNQTEFEAGVKSRVYGKKYTGASYSETIAAYETEAGKLLLMTDQTSASLKQSTADNFLANKEAHEKALLDYYNAEVEMRNWEIQRGKEIREGYVKLYADLGQTGANYMALRKMQIEEEATAMEKLGIKGKIVADWMEDRLRKLWAEETYMGQKFSEVVKNTESSMADALQGWMDGSKNFEEGFDGIMKSIVQSTQRAIAEMIAAWIRYQIMMKILGALPGGLGQMFQSMAGNNPFPAKTGHNGGRVGSLTTSKNVDPMIFANASRYHGGGTVSKLGPREVPIIANEDEVISQSGQGGGDTFNIHINSIDAASSAQWAMKNKHSLAAAFTAAKAKNDPSRRG